MQQNEIRALFDQLAENYDKQWEKTAPIRNCLHFLLDGMFAKLPTNARVLCVGVGTGAELSHLAQRNPHWHFTAVEPSGSMLAICRQRAEKEGFVSRCQFHEGYLESLPAEKRHDAGTCFLVSQFILDQQSRTGFFREIANRLVVGGPLASSDLASDVNSPDYDTLLHAWGYTITSADPSTDGVKLMRKAYAQDVGVLAPSTVASIIESAGFERPVLFFQAGLIHAWVAKCARANR